MSGGGVTFRFTIARAHVMSANDREHYHLRRKRTAYLRALGLERGVELVKGGADALPLLDGPVQLDVAIAWPDRRRRDTPNAYPTVKALLDGLVDAGILSDDRDGVIVATTMRPVLGRVVDGDDVELTLKLEAVR